MLENISLDSVRQISVSGPVGSGNSYTQSGRALLFAMQKFISVITQELKHLQNKRANPAIHHILRKHFFLLLKPTFFYWFKRRKYSSLTLFMAGSYYFLFFLRSFFLSIYVLHLSRQTTSDWLKVAWLSSLLRRRFTAGGKNFLLFLSVSPYVATTVVPNSENPPTINSLDLISQVFPCKFWAVPKISVSGHCSRSTSKTCQIVVGAVIRQFHEFFNLIFGGFLPLCPSVSLSGLLKQSVFRALCPCTILL